MFVRSQGFSPRFCWVSWRQPNRQLQLFSTSGKGARRCAPTVATAVRVQYRSHDLILTLLSRDQNPETWATLHHNLGTAYRNRIRGERAENIESAIASYQTALQVSTREACPTDWASTPNNLGLAYSSRIQGELAENIERAIASFEAALQVYTRDAFPTNWARTH